mgnify:FL=1
MASYSPVSNKLNFSVGFNPTSAFPLDVRTMFGSLAEAKAAAATAVNAGSSDSAYYFGMILTVFENDVATHYSIQGDKTLKEVGKSVAGDDKTIVLSGEVLTLKDFGTKYYAYVAETETEAAHYVETTGWKEGLVPQVIKNGESYELAWYEPSSTTVEGLQKNITALQKTVTDTTAQAEANKTAITGLRTDVNAAQADITKFKGDETTEGSIKYEANAAVAAMLADAPEAFDTLKEIADWCSNHSQEVTQMQSDINKNKSDISTLNTLVGKLPETATSKDVISYIAEAIKDADAAKKFGDIITHNVAEFATAAQGAKADTAVQKVEAGTENGHISVDGKDVKVYEPATASTAGAGMVKVDGTSISATEDGTISVEAVDAAKVTGLDEKVDGAKTAAVESANSYTDENAVAKTAIVKSTDEASAEASDEKVLSEKAIRDMFTWKTTM